MYRFLPLLLAAAIGAQSPLPEDSTKVEVPTFANRTCPIMGKKVSMPLFIDTEVGRFYVCCKPCFKKIRKDLEAAHKTAYPVVETVDNKVCPVSGEPVGKDAETVTLQGYAFKVCCAGCVDAARTDSQLTLTKVTRAGVEDLGNATCPITGKPVEANAFVLLDNALVRLSDEKLVEDVAKAPAATLARARKISKAQKPKAKHAHTPKAGKDAPKKAPKASGGAK